MGLFRIEDPSILLGDHNYDLHFGHNQDEQERYPPSFLGKSDPNTIEKYEKKEKISSRNPWDKRTSCWYYWLELNKTNFVPSINFCLPTKKQDKTKTNKFSNTKSQPQTHPIISPALHPNPSQHHATEVPTKAAATGAVSETGCGTEGIPVATAAATAWAALVATLWPSMRARLGPRDVEVRWKKPNQKEGEGVRRNFNNNKESTQKHIDFEIWIEVKPPVFWGWHLFGWLVFQSSRHFCWDGKP